MAPKLLIIETSDRPGLTALAQGGRLLGERRLDEARRHARDLAPAVAALLREQGWHAHELNGVIVSRGPGSYTGLRVGIMSAKTLAYALGCRLFAIDTFDVIARQAPAEAQTIDVVSDAQQNNVYVQRFARQPSGVVASAAPLTIVPFADWRAQLSSDDWATGPALAERLSELPVAAQIVPEVDWRPHAESLLALGMERWQRGEHDDPVALEPLYLRRSSAEEKWDQRVQPQPGS